jgi:hypothetical protein
MAPHPELAREPQQQADPPEQLADGLWRWTARHPEWHPSGFGNEVASFALKADGVGVLIDPLLPPESDAVLQLVDDLATDQLAIFATVPYHVRSAEELWRRHRGRASIHGHPAAAKRLSDRSGFEPIEPGAELPAGATAHAIGSPRRHEMPLFFPSHHALAFGDTVAEVDGALRVWDEPLTDAQRARWYRERFLPTLEPLLDLDPQRILVTHGAPVLDDGRARLAAAFAQDPWSRRAS